MTDVEKCGTSLTMMVAYLAEATWECDLPKGHKGVHIANGSVTPVAWPQLYLAPACEETA